MSFWSPPAAIPVIQDFVPVSNGLYSIGSSALRWKDGYFTGIVRVPQVRSASNLALYAQDAQMVDIDGANSRISFLGSLSLGAPVTKTANFTVAANENIFLCAGGGTITVTLPNHVTFPGRIIVINTKTAQLVNSASANVQLIDGGALGGAILTATAGKWAVLISDGVTGWRIMMAN